MTYHQAVLKVDCSQCHFGPSSSPRALTFAHILSIFPNAHTIEGDGSEILKKTSSFSEIHPTFIHESTWLVEDHDWYDEPSHPEVPDHWEIIHRLNFVLESLWGDDGAVDTDEDSEENPDDNENVEDEQVGADGEDGEEGEKEESGTPKWLRPMEPEGAKPSLNNIPDVMGYWLRSLRFDAEDLKMDNILGLLSRWEPRGYGPTDEIYICTSRVQLRHISVLGRFIKAFGVRSLTLTQPLDGAGPFLPLSSLIFKTIGVHFQNLRHLEIHLDLGVKRLCDCAKGAPCSMLPANQYVTDLEFDMDNTFNFKLKDRLELETLDLTLRPAMLDCWKQMSKEEARFVIYRSLPDPLAMAQALHSLVKPPCLPTFLPKGFGLLDSGEQRPIFDQLTFSMRRALDRLRQLDNLPCGWQQNPKGESKAPEIPAE